MKARVCACAAWGRYLQLMLRLVGSVSACRQHVLLAFT